LSHYQAQPAIWHSSNFTQQVKKARNFLIVLRVKIY